MSSSDKFDTFAHEVHKGVYSPPHKLVAFDPGHITGVSIFIDGQLEECEQLDTHPMSKGIDTLNEFITEDIDLIVFEDYRVYSWKADDHINASLHTPQLIGVIKCLAQLKDIKTHSQMAQQAKGFCTDDRLKEWLYYMPGLKHGRDAIRHACYYLLFNLNKPTNNL